eukprot:1160042-Pelagomonas_calceolata.AAC.5
MEGGGRHTIQGHLPLPYHPFRLPARTSSQATPAATSHPANLAAATTLTPALLSQHPNLVWFHFTPCAPLPPLHTTAREGAISSCTSPSHSIRVAAPHVVDVPTTAAVATAPATTAAAAAGVAQHATDRAQSKIAQQHLHAR